MPNRSFERGKRAERKARAILEAEGYYVMVSAGSKGIFDLLGLIRHAKPLDGQPIVRCIQVKAGRKISKAELEAIEAAPVPPLASKEVWRFLPRVAEPEITFVR